MYQPIRYYEEERRGHNNCACCLLLIFGLISVSAFIVVCSTSYEFFSNPLASIYDEFQASIAFDEFVKEYGKTYSSATEMEIRKVIFTQNYKAIMEHNRKYSWLVLGVNEMTDLTDDEYSEEYLSAPEPVNEKCTVAQVYIRKNSHDNS